MEQMMQFCFYGNNNNLAKPWLTKEEDEHKSQRSSIGLEM